jgi:hypothetical protein
MQCYDNKNAFGGFISDVFNQNRLANEEEEEESKPASLVLYPSSLVSLVLYQGPIDVRV